MEESQNSLINRIPPNDIEAEQCVLGAMIFDKEGLSLAAEQLSSDDFYRRDHKVIFECAFELFSANIPVDIVTLKDKLVSKGMLENIGGVKYLSEIASSVYSSLNVKYHSKIVSEKSQFRKLLKAAGEITTLSYEAKESVDYVIDKAEKSILDIASKRNSEEFSHIKDVLVESFDRIEKIYLSKEKITGIKTGFTDFDYKTTGLQPSDLILIAARPSMGKTAFALNIAENAAIKEKASTAIFSLEMSKNQLAQRLICQQSLVDSQKIRTGALSGEDFINISRSMGNLATAPLYIDDTPGISPMELRAKCRKLKIERGLDLIIIDYLQLMNVSGKGESRQQEITEISRSLKAIAREMNVPVIALSQLSRAPETRSDHKPILSDLRESGAIEQDADVVAFLYRDEYYNNDTEKKNIAEINIAKQRNGPTGTVELIWRADCTKFENIEYTKYAEI